LVPSEREKSSHFVTSFHLNALTSCRATRVPCFLQLINLHLLAVSDGVSAAIPEFLT
jgi:hypothetical protein